MTEREELAKFLTGLSDSEWENLAERDRYGYYYQADRLIAAGYRKEKR